MQECGGAALDEQVARSLGGRGRGLGQCVGARGVGLGAVSGPSRHSGAARDLLGGVSK